MNVIDKHENIEHHPTDTAEVIHRRGTGRLVRVTGAFPGIGTLINVAAIVIGSLLGLAVGHRLSERTREVSTDALGLVCLLIAGLSAVAVTDDVLTAAVGPGVGLLVVLGSLVLGGLLGSVLAVEDKVESLAGWVQSRFAGASGRQRFVEGFVTASLLYCVGPLVVLGSLSDGLGTGIDQLLLKAVLDGVASIAFAATFGISVMFSAASVAVVQGSLTVVGVLAGSLLPDAAISALTATGGLILIGQALRLLRIRQVAVADLLPALLIAPALTQLVTVLD
jgi:uncharacterized membrane protein YqgA involved in biofilm formation